MTIFFAFVIALLGIILLGGLPLHYRRELRKAEARADQQFRAFRACDSIGQVLLDGTTAKVLDRSNSYTSHNGRIHEYVQTLFVVSPEGKHFLFKSSEAGRPYVAPLTPERAKLVLKDKYLEVDSSDA